MPKLMKYILFACLLAPAAFACSPAPRQPVTQDEVFAQSDIVLTGKVIAVTAGLPEDFAPAQPQFLANKRAEAAKQDIKVIGQTIRLSVTHAYKGVQGAELTVLDQAERRINSCDAAYDWQVGDAVTVFANHDGNYVVLPAMLDSRAFYTRFDPRVRYGKIGPDHPYAKPIAAETAYFEKILQALPQ